MKDQFYYGLCATCENKLTCLYTNFIEAHELELCFKYKCESKNSESKCEFYDKCPSHTGWCKAKSYSKECVPFLEVAFQNLKGKINE